MRDRVLLTIAYVLLVGSVAFLGWDVDRKLERNADIVCRMAAVSLISNLAIAGEGNITQEGFDAILEALSAIEDTCGSRLLNYEPPGLQEP